MGAGKSTVGLRLAKELGWTFVDLDEEIVRTEGKSIATIFESSGEAYFRDREHSALRKTLTHDGIVLALGGGAIETEANRPHLQENPETLLIYLEAPLEILMVRCEEQQLSNPTAPRRPVLENRSELEKRFLRRKPLYEMAHWTVETAEADPEQTVQIILKRWRESGVKSSGQAVL